jgi:hypothetical protein
MPGLVIVLTCVLIGLIGYIKIKSRRAYRAREEQARMDIVDQIFLHINAHPYESTRRELAAKARNDFKDFKEKFSDRSLVEFRKGFIVAGKFETQKCLDTIRDDLKWYAKMEREVNAELRAENRARKNQGPTYISGPSRAASSGMPQFKFTIYPKAGGGHFYEFITAQNDNQARATIAGRYPSSQFRIESNGQVRG